MKDAALRVGWMVVVVGAGVALVRGLWLTTYFELTPQAAADAERGRLWMWGATVTLAAAATAAARWWQVSPWSLAALVVAAPIGLVADDLDWIPLVALVASGPLLSVGLTGALLAPVRPPQDERLPPTAG